jgi:hypothetical protein
MIEDWGHLFGYDSAALVMTLHALTAYAPRASAALQLVNVGVVQRMAPLAVRLLLQALAAGRAASANITGVQRRRPATVAEHEQKAPAVAVPSGIAYYNPAAEAFTDQSFIPIAR